MRTSQLLGSVLLTLPPALPEALPAQERSGPVVQAMARGEIRLPADVAVVRLGNAARASTAAAAATETGRRVRAITDSLRRWNLAPELTAPLALEVHTNEDYSEGRLVDYEAKAVLTVRVRDFDRLGAIVDGALAAGATTVPSIRFESDTAESARMDALELAYTQARAKAEAVARAAGVTLGALMDLDTGRGYEFGEGYDDFIYDDMPSSVLRVPRRDVLVSALVTARWQLVPCGP